MKFMGNHSQPFSEVFHTVDVSTQTTHHAVKQDLTDTGKQYDMTDMDKDKFSTELKARKALFRHAEHDGKLQKTKNFRSSWNKENWKT